jgi:hypothetical protein
MKPDTFMRLYYLCQLKIRNENRTYWLRENWQGD